MKKPEDEQNINPDNLESDTLDTVVGKNSNRNRSRVSVHKRRIENLLSYFEYVPDVGYSIGSAVYDEIYLRISINDTTSDLNMRIVEEDFKLYLEPIILNSLTEKIKERIDKNAQLLDFDIEDNTLIIFPSQESGWAKRSVSYLLETYSVFINNTIQK